MTTETCDLCQHDQDAEEMAHCDAYGWPLCHACFGEHAARCSACAASIIDYDIMRPGK